ncbi:MAG TPA: arginine--tRNA ligase [Armatimonadaceae bacterium]|nr:arginine--tRNA ligase [Armatimonadaceae bacterium]
MSETTPSQQPSYVHDALRAEATALVAATGLARAEDVSLVTPKPNIPADLALPVFPLAKAAGANPNELAQRIAAAVTPRPDGLIGKVEPMGGFVNFVVAPERFASAALGEVLARADAYGEDRGVGGGAKTVVEYSSPNIARKMHVGHLRSTVIGNSVRRILAALGYDVIADNHLGDWGTQFGTLLAALDQWKLTPWDDADPVQSLVEVYARYNNAAKEDPALMDAARAWFRKLEEGDPWARATWQRLIDITMVEFERTYKRLGVAFDTTHGESYYEPVLDALIREAIDKGVARIEADGAVSVDFGEALPSFLLRKSDGATLYQTRDVATAIWRWKEYAPARNIYVVGAEQRLHFQQVFETVRRMGYPEIADRSVHIPFGAVTDAGGQRFSMRKGTAIFLDEVLDEAVERAEAVMREQIAAGRSEVTEEEVAPISEMLGLGAVTYADLYQGPERNIRFDWDKMLSFDGNTATYIQYTHARCRSILRKAGGDADVAATLAGADASLLTEPEAQVVLKQLSKLPQAVREAGEKFAPATVADWTYNVAREYARFYDRCPVLKAETPELRAARLALTAAVAQGLKNGLALLGIGAPERM